MRRLTLGPGVLVTAAFIGPGTVTACTLAGANFAYALLWALVFATLSTLVLQEMCTRLGTISGKGLGEALLHQFSRARLRWPLLTLILVAILIGNSAYEAGNLAGAALGLEAIFATDNAYQASVCVLALLAGLVLYKGAYHVIERVLVALVLLMALAFALTFFVVKPDLLAMLKGSFIPSFPDGSTLTVMALIGTTIVPYNLFLHAAASKRRWHDSLDLRSARQDSFISISLGGLIAIFIVSCAAASLFQHGIQVHNAGDMAHQFEPLFGSASRYLFGFGLFAAGLSSAITAPLATGYVVGEVFDKPEYSRWIALIVVLIGALLALTGIKPINIIVLAQFANGLLLPIIALFLLYAMNQSSLLAEHVNRWPSNVLGTVVILLTLGLGAKAIAGASGLL